MRDNRKEEFKRWFDQANYDLKAGFDSLEKENFEWACFQSQQAGEKALKAYLSLKGEVEILSHSINRLLKECTRIESTFQTILRVKELDQYYIPTRYPNSLPDGIPHQYYNKEDAEKCLGYAREIIKCVKKLAGI